MLGEAAGTRYLPVTWKEKWMLPVRRAQEHFSLSAASLPLVTSTRDTGVATALSNTALETNRAAMKQSFIKLLLKEKQLSTMGHQGTARTWRKELSSVFPGKCSCSSFRPSRGPCERHPASCVCVCVCVCVWERCFSVQLFATADSVGFPRQEYWSACHFLSQGIFLTQGLNFASPALAGGLFTNSAT